MMSHIQPTPRVFLIGNAQKPNASAAFERLGKWLEQRGVLVGSDLDGKPESILAVHPDFVMALGGDGTILAVSQAMQHRQAPIIGVNLGKLGYLAHFSVDDVERHLERIFSDASLVSRRMILDVLITTAGGQISRGIAINDCVIRVGEPFRTVGLSVQVDDHPVTTIVSDGLIVATPTGSTAHNMACGGPILFPDVDAIILTPLSPHSLTHRPVVVGPDAKVSIAVRQTSSGAAVVLDGQWVSPLPGGSSITIRRSPTSFQLVENPDRRSWDLLVQKLRWGQALT
jgi:NAD+ kinase